MEGNALGGGISYWIVEEKGDGRVNCRWGLKGKECIGVACDVLCIINILFDCF